MSAPRPFVTDPFHPLDSICNNYSFLFIYQSVPVISSMWYVQVCLSYGTYLTTAHVPFKNTQPKFEDDDSSYSSFHTKFQCMLTQNTRSFLMHNL